VPLPFFFAPLFLVLRSRTGQKKSPVSCEAGNKKRKEKSPEKKGKIRAKNVKIH